MDEPNDVRSAASELSKLGAAKGGKARASVLTEAERKEISRAAAIARWKKIKGPDYAPPEPSARIAEEKGGKHPRAAAEDGLPYSMFQGSLGLGSVRLECHVLNDGRRVFTQREMLRVLTGGQTGVLRRYLERLPDSKKLLSMQPIHLKIPGIPGIAFGFEAILLVEICEAYLRARDEGELKREQKHLAKQAEIILRSCAKVGIIALVDEATGYQQYRAKQALQLKLQAFIAEEMQDWARMFPEEFWHELARLEGIRYSAHSRPLRWGQYVMAFVYDAIDKDVGKKLREINPDPHYKQNHHQWLREFGRDKVNNQIHRVIGTMQACDTIAEFKQKFARVFKKLPTQLDLDFGPSPSPN